VQLDNNNSGRYRILSLLYIIISTSKTQIVNNEKGSFGIKPINLVTDKNYNKIDKYLE